MAADASHSKYLKQGHPKVNVDCRWALGGGGWGGQSLISKKERIPLHKLPINDEFKISSPWVLFNFHISILGAFGQTVARLPTHSFHATP